MNPYTDFPEKQIKRLERLSNQLGDGVHKCYQGSTVTISDSLITVDTGSNPKLLSASKGTGNWIVYSGNYSATPTCNIVDAEFFLAFIISGLQEARKKKLFDRISARPEYRLSAKILRKFGIK